MRVYKWKENNGFYSCKFDENTEGYISGDYVGIVVDRYELEDNRMIDEDIVDVAIPKWYFEELMKKYNEVKNAER